MEGGNSVGALSGGGNSWMDRRPWRQRWLAGAQKMKGGAPNQTARGAPPSNVREPTQCPIRPKTNKMSICKRFFILVKPQGRGGAGKNSTTENN